MTTSKILYETGMSFEIDILFEGSFLTAFLLSSLDIKLKENFFFTIIFFCQPTAFFNFKSEIC